MPRGLLSTITVLLGPADGAVLPAASLAVPAAIVMPNVPSPVMLLIVTVREVLSVPLTPMAPFAVPVLFKVILDAVRLTKSAPV